MIKITLVFVVFFVIIWFMTEMLKKFGTSKLFWKIFVKISGLLILTIFAVLNMIWLF